MLGTGAGGDSESEKSLLTRDGNRSACKSGDATSAPEGCSGILRLELLAVGAHRPLCKETERYNGERCEPLPAPIPVSDERRAQLEQACKLGASVACKLLKVVGTR